MNEEKDDLQAQLAAAQLLKRELELELEKIRGELSRSRHEQAQLRERLSVVFRSATWKAALSLNRILARLIPGQRGAAGFDSLLMELDGVRKIDLDPWKGLESSSRLSTSTEYLTENPQGLLSFDISPTIVRVQCAGDQLLVDDLMELAGPFVKRSGDGPSIDEANVVFTDADGPTDVRATDRAQVWWSRTDQRRYLENPDYLAVRTADDLALALVRRCLTAALADPDWQPPFHAWPYMDQNDDVAQTVTEGHMSDPEAHWRLNGEEECKEGWRSYRPWLGPVSRGLRQSSRGLEALAAEEIDNWLDPPLISVLVPVYRVDLQWLQAAVESVVGQLYPHWELCLIDDASDRADIADYLTELAQSDDRIRIRLLDQNVGIALASQAALEMATGEYIALLDHDDELTVDALYLVARVIVRDRPQIIYSDEAKLDMKGRICDSHHKSGFSPELILSQNYISHLGVYQRDLVERVGGFRPGYEGSQDHDLLLRALSLATSIFHIPRVLYFWRKVPQSTAARFSSKSYAWDAGVNAVGEVAGENAQVTKGQFPGTYRVQRPIVGNPKVSIIIPFRNQPRLLDQCLESLLTHTAYQNFEVIGVNNQSDDLLTIEAMERWAERDRRIRFVDFDAPFNYAAINNLAARHADGEHLLLLNNDVELMADEWLNSLLEFSQQPAIGAVGGRLLYPDRTVQHAGVILGVGGVAGHSHKYFPREHHGYFCRPHLIQNVSAVTGACLMVKKQLYLAAGGLDDEHLTVAFNDIDFCLRLLELGYRNVYTPYCELIHHESKSRGMEDNPEKQQRFAGEALYMKRRHRKRMSTGDPWYNPNLSLVQENFSQRGSQ